MTWSAAPYQRVRVSRPVLVVALLVVAACTGQMGPVDDDADEATPPDGDADTDVDTDTDADTDADGDADADSDTDSDADDDLDGDVDGDWDTDGGGDADADTDTDSDMDVDLDEDEDIDTCAPRCAGRECGPDECGGTCRPGCEAGERCNTASGRCECVPRCAGRVCGPDGCGGSCGRCPAGVFCGPTGTCGCAGPDAPSPTAFGFNYAPPTGYDWWLSRDHELFVEDFSRDLVVMASLGATVVRLPVLPFRNGLMIREDAGPGSFDPVMFDALSRHLPDIIEQFGRHGISVVLSIHPISYYISGPDEDTTWAEWTYGDDWAEDLTEDLIVWGTDLVELVETSSACSNVLYYDMHNELNFRDEVFRAMVQAQHARVPVPAGKRGQSVLFASDADRVPEVMAAAGRTLDFLDFHTYPHINTAIPSIAARLSDLVPSAHILLGEFGAGLEDRTEPGQRAFVVSVLDQAQRAHVTAALHWSLWDLWPFDTETLGLGHTPNEPRDSYGAIAEMRGHIPASDFESSLGGWFVGGTTDSVSVRRQGPVSWDAATGEWYGRLMATTAGTYWFCSPMFDVSGTRLAVSGYVRSNGTALALDAHLFDAAMSEDIERLEFTLPPTWSFSHVQDRLGGQVHELAPGTTRAFLCVMVTAPAGTSAETPVYLDVDAFSASSFTPR